MVRAFLAGVLAICVLLFFALSSQDRAQGGPLAPPDATSPAAALKTFRMHSQKAEDISWQTASEIRNSQRLRWTPQNYAEARKADTEMERAARTLDLTGILPAIYDRRKIESVLLLNEILDRIELPPADKIPADGSLASWTIPGTEIRLVKIPEGPRAGDYVFSTDTVSRLPEFYAKIRGLPSLSASDLDYYQYYSHSPGGLIPPAWFHQIQKWVPIFGHFEIADQAGWQWLATFLSAAFLSFLVYLAARLARSVNDLGTPAASIVAAFIVPGAAWIACRAFVKAISDINITGTLFDILDLGATTLSYVAAAWMVMSVSMRLAEFAHLWMKGQSKLSIDASLVRTLIRVVGFIGAVSILAQGLTDLGVPLMGVIAGLGIGGLAIALAAQPTIENLIGGVMLYLDRPVRVGDWCEFGEHRGVVEEIGLRSTRIRTRDKTLITVTNADFAKMKIINLSRGDRGVVRLKLNLPYDMPVEQIEKLLHEMRVFLAGHSMVDETSASVYLSDLSNSAATVEISTEIIVEPGQKMSPIREELLLGLARIADRYEGRRITA